MSYILDALKKSEAERSQADGSKGAALRAAQPVPKSGSALFWLIGALLIMNGLLLSLYLGGGDREEPMVNGAGEQSVAGETGVAPVPSASQPPDSRDAGRGEGSADAVTGMGAARLAPGPAAPRDETRVVEASIADLMVRKGGVGVEDAVVDGKQDEVEQGGSPRGPRAAPEVPATPAPSREGVLIPQTESPVVAELIQEELADRKRRRDGANGETVAVAPVPVAGEVAAVATDPVESRDGRAAHARIPEPNAPPLLDDMSPDFRERVPDLGINVYVYAEEPERRFVMINMRKYREGNRLGEGLVLEAIGKEALTLDFEGTRFRVAR